jgi:hypothetical protein
MPGSYWVEQRVVGAQAGGLAEPRGLFAHQLQHLLEQRRVAGPVVGRALAAPGVLASRGGEAQPLHQRGGQRVAGAPGALHLAQRGAFEFAQRLALGAPEQLRQVGGGGQLVQQSAHLGQRGGACLVALRRHIGRAVPVGDGLQMPQAVHAQVAAGEFLVGGQLRHGANSPGKTHSSREVMIR